MGYNPAIHHRRSIRLKGYDYSQPGAYFLTLCTQDRKCLYGEIVDDKMCLNDAGQMVQTVWNEIPAYYPGIDIDAFMIMPNHIHGIIKIVGAPPRGLPEPTDVSGTRFLIWQSDKKRELLRSKKTTGNVSCVRGCPLL